MASTYLSRTYQSGGNRKKWTISVWVKEVKFHQVMIICFFNLHVSNYIYCPFDSNDRLRFQDQVVEIKSLQKKI